MRSMRFVLVAALAVACQTMPTGAQTPADDQRIEWERGINESRDERLLALAPQLMPECRIQASDAEIVEFFDLWRIFAGDEIRLKAKFDAAVRPGTVFPPEAPEIALVVLQSVSANLPGAADAARDEIEVWHLYRCVDKQFHGAKYFDHSYGTAFRGNGTVIRENIPPTFARVPGNELEMRVPDMSIVEPIEALGKFFRTALAKGLLKFNDIDEEKYFFVRYETDYFVNLHESNATRRWFGDPPWLSATKP